MILVYRQEPFYRVVVAECGRTIRKPTFGDKAAAESYAQAFNDRCGWTGKQASVELVEVRDTTHPWWWPLYAAATRRRAKS